MTLPCVYCMMGDGLLLWDDLGQSDVSLVIQLTLRQVVRDEPSHIDASVGEFVRQVVRGQVHDLRGGLELLYQCVWPTALQKKHISSWAPIHGYSRTQDDVQQ